MDKKCNEYENLFVFGSEDDILNHIQHCQECRLEYLKMQKTVALIKEAKPYFVKQTQTHFYMKIAAAFMFLCLSYFVLDKFDVFNGDNELLNNESCISQMGFPTDEYGLLKLD